jgi:glycogen operon protein
VHGSYDPQNGHRCNRQQAAARPYAKASDGDIDWSQACFSYTWGDEESFNDEDSGPHMSKSVVISPVLRLGQRPHPRTPYSETIIYEAHVKG